MTQRPATGLRRADRGPTLVAEVVKEQAKHDKEGLMDTLGVNVRQSETRQETSTAAGHLSLASQALNRKCDSMWFLL